MQCHIDDKRSSANSRAADDSDHYLAKCLVEWDRAEGQRELGARVSLHRCLVGASIWSCLQL